jgi:hypothetical protein
VAGETLIEQRVERPQQEPYKRRVTDDGRYEEWSALRYVFEDGTTTFEPQEPKWRLQWELRPEDVEELREAIRSSGFLGLRERYEPSGTSIGGSVVVWRADVDGRTHEVTLVGVPDVEVPEVQQLEARLGEVLQRASDARHAGG